MNKQQLASTIWQSANQMRSKIEANDGVNTFKDTGKAALGLAVLVGGTALTVLTNGKNKS